MITGSRMDWEKSETERLPDCPLREIAKPTVLPIAEIHFDEDKMREICKEVAENLVVEYDFKGKTNGEVIKAVFPNFHTDEMSHTVWVGYDAMSFHRDWWDSPYEPQERSDKE